MPNANSSVKCICPYYRAHSGKSIACESLVPDTRVLIRFATEEDRQRYQKLACCTYEYGRRCCHAAALDEWYRVD